MQETPITEIFPKKNQIKDKLIAAGYDTLEACGKAGSYTLLKITGLGFGTVLALRAACHRRRIPWIKDEDEQRWAKECEAMLMAKYEVPQYMAHIIAEIRFQEGWFAKRKPQNIGK